LEHGWERRGRGDTGARGKDPERKARQEESVRRVGGRAVEGEEWEGKVEWSRCGRGGSRMEDVGAVEVEEGAAGLGKERGKKEVAAEFVGGGVSIGVTSGSRFSISKTELIWWSRTPMINERSDRQGGQGKIHGLDRRLALSFAHCSAYPSNVYRLPLDLMLGPERSQTIAVDLGLSSWHSDGLDDSAIVDGKDDELARGGKEDCEMKTYECPQDDCLQQWAQARFERK
jgi:hypothetical protein